MLAIVLFGAGWLPKAARNLGRAKVEIDKTQKQLTDAKQQMVEATGMDKAEATIRKANRALNQSPKNLIKGAAISAMTPARDQSDEILDAELVDTPDAPQSDSADDETVNVDWSADSIDDEPT